MVKGVVGLVAGVFAGVFVGAFAYEMISKKKPGGILKSARQKISNGLKATKTAFQEGYRGKPKTAKETPGA